MTRIDYYQIELDNQEVPVSLTFSIEAEGNPNFGFYIKSAHLEEYTVYLHQKQGEDPSQPGTIHTKWFLEHIYHTNKRQDVEMLLTKQWEMDQELAAETQAAG